MAGIRTISDHAGTRARSVSVRTGAVIACPDRLQSDPARGHIAATDAGEALSKGTQIPLVGPGATKRAGELHEIAHAHEGRERRRGCEIVAIRARKCPGPGLVSAIAACRVPGRDQIDL